MFALIGCQFAQKVHTKCAKVVDEKNYQQFCCLSVCDFEPKILFKGVHLTILEKCSIERYIVYLKKQKLSICHRIPFYSVLNMSKGISYMYSLNYQTLKLKQNTQNARSVSFVH